MALENISHGFCEHTFWDHDLTWNSKRPQLTPCFQETLLTFVPLMILLLIAPLELYYVNKCKTKPIECNCRNICRLILFALCILANSAELIFNLYKYMNSQSYASSLVASTIKIVTFLIIIFLLHHCRKRGRHTSFAPWFISLISVLFTIPKLLDVIFAKESLAKYEHISVIVYFSLLLLAFLFCFFSDLDEKSYRSRKSSEKAPSGKVCPQLFASFPSLFTFWWINGLVLSGYRRSLRLDDLWNLREEDKSENVGTLFEKKLNRQFVRASFNNQAKETKIVSSPKKKPRGILRTFISSFGLTFGSFFILKLFSDILQLITPLILKQLIAFTKSESNEPLWHGIVFAVAMFITTFCQSILSNYFFYCSYTIGMKMRSSLISVIYKKSLKLSNESRNSATTGEIVNLMSIDAQRCQEFMQFAGYMFSAPIQITLITAMLFTQMGKATLAGLFVMFLLIPVNIVIGLRTRTLQGRQMKQKDKRIKAMSEMLNGIKILKLYAWENSFINNILGLRKHEVKLLKSIAYLNCATTFLFACAPFVVSFATFVVYVLIDSTNVLTPEKVFVSLAYFGALRVPLTLLPSTFSYLIMTLVSIKRIDKFLQLDELEDYVDKSEVKAAIVFENATFSWSEKQSNAYDNESFVCELKADPQLPLKNINFTVPEGSLVTIVGNVGSGKSSLLSALLGEMTLVSGKIKVNRKLRFAYVAQQAWIENLTLRDNILFGKPFDGKRYKEVIRACALEPDLMMLPAGDMTEIGEKGINLSGGQKQRISLARACYHDDDIYLLDDPLSAVDAFVAKHIFENVLSSETGILKDKTRVLVTNSIDLLPNVDVIVVLKDGRISEKGAYEELLNNKGEFASFINRHSAKGGNDIEQEQLDESVKEKLKKQKSLELSTTVPKGQLIEAEFAESGNVKLTVYHYYFRAMTYFWVIICVFGFVGAQLSSVGSNVWLSMWSNDNVTGNATKDIKQRDYRLTYYGALGAAQVFLILFGAVSLVQGTMRASVSIHKNLLARVMRSPMSFFETTPLGRIVNRFSKDLDAIDVTLPSIISNWMICFFEVAATLVLITVQTPLFAIALIPVAILFYFCQKIYVSSSRQLKRLESVTRSPIYSHFGSTLSGVSTIRAFSVENKFIHESNQRVDVNQSCYYPSVVANRWIGVRLEFCSNCITLFAALFAVLARDNLSSGMIGLSVTYALNTTQMLNWLVRVTSDIETQITSVERIEEYTKLPAEDDWEKSGYTLPDNWPQNGLIEFQDYGTRYREGLELVLKNIFAVIEPCEKIGIVGRTGAGKSTITLALFRLIEAASGKILIDEQDISILGLHDLRSRLTIIPQDPVLFSGTLRMNLDPFENFSDDKIWKALEHSYLKHFVSTLEKGLLHDISEGGSNLSVGQRQLICLARALLRKTKILILDEATAAVDMETDSLIQNAIRREFKECTVITIAHRLNTVIDSDRILVLDKGMIKEFDSPSNLLANKFSMFYSLAKDAGIV